MPFLKRIECSRSEENDDDDEFPFGVPAVRSLADKGLDLHPGITFLVGENGSGKSTILEGIADKWGFEREGGSRTKNLIQKAYWSELGPRLSISRSPGLNPMDGFFLRAESFFNFASMIDAFEDDWQTATNYFSYGGKSLHHQSHGESFLSLFLNRFGEHGVYLLDEPEAALSPSRQLSFMVRMHDLIGAHSQFIIATHSPILLGYPGAKILRFDEDGIEEITYEETDPYVVTKRFLTEKDRMLQYLFAEDEQEGGE